MPSGHGLLLKPQRLLFCQSFYIFQPRVSEPSWDLLRVLQRLSEAAEAVFISPVLVPVHRFVFQHEEPEKPVGPQEAAAGTTRRFRTSGCRGFTCSNILHIWTRRTGRALSSAAKQTSHIHKPDVSTADSKLKSEISAQNQAGAGPGLNFTCWSNFPLNWQPIHSILVSLLIK